MSYDGPPQSLNLGIPDDVNILGQPQDYKEVIVDKTPLSSEEYLVRRQKGILLDIEGSAMSGNVTDELIQSARDLSVTGADIASMIHRGESQRIPDFSIYDSKFISEEINRLKQINTSTEVVAIEGGQRRFIHSTGEYSANQITINGLHCSPNGLGTTAVGLSGEDIEGNYKKLAQRHKKADHVVVIDLPNLPSDLQAALEQKEKSSGVRVPIDSLFVRQMTVKNEDGKETTFTGIPPKFIKGTFNAKSGEWYGNGSYDLELSEEDKKVIIENLFLE